MIIAELESLETTKTQDIVECPESINMIGFKWVFNIKRNTAGEINNYKV